MATKTANLYARIEPDVKEEAEKILDSLGVPASNAINMFYKQIILHRGLPFDVALPETKKPVGLEAMSREQFDEMISEGFEAIQRGETENYDDVKKKMREKYGL